MFKFKKKKSLTFRDTKSYKCGLEKMIVIFYHIL